MTTNTNAALREKLIDMIAEHLSGTYRCLRVWEAWNFGTMSQDDFDDVGESDTPAELAAAILAALATAAAAVPAIPDAITHTIQRALVKFSDSELERLRTLREPENAAVATFGMARIAAQQNIDDADAALNWLAAAAKAEPAEASKKDRP